MIVLAVAFTLAVFGPGCGINKGAQDTTTPEEDTSSSDGEDGNDSSDGADSDDGADSSDGSSDSSGTVDGCKWLGGEWTFRDCNTPDGFSVAFAGTTGCGFNGASANPLFEGLAIADENGFALTQPGGSQCHGYYDNVTLDGSCGNGGSTCWFYAVKN